jgi:hypothetical protein
VDFTSLHVTSWSRKPEVVSVNLSTVRQRAWSLFVVPLAPRRVGCRNSAVCSEPIGFAARSNKCTPRGQPRDRPPHRVVGIFPNDRALRLAASVVIEQNDEWPVGRRYLSNQSLEAVLNDYSKDNSGEEAPELSPA